MIPYFLLEQILCGEKDEKDFYAEYGIEELQNALAKLRKSDEEILKKYAADEMQARIKEKMKMSKNTGTVKLFPEQAKLHKSTFHIVKFCAAAMLVFAFAMPLIVDSIKKPVETAGTDSIRIKGNGHHQIRLYRQSGDDVILLKNGDSAKENDLIQITYTPGVYNYGVIFSVDGNKNITRHFPEDSWKAEKLEKTGQEVPLSFSYSLDDAPEYECFIFVASKNDFDFSGIEKIDSNKLNIDFLKNGSYLPKDCDGSIFILKKNNQ